MASDLFGRVPGDEKVRHGGVSPVGGVMEGSVAGKVDGQDVGPRFLEQAANFHGTG